MSGSSQGVYHIELRHFPHNLCRFNLTEPQLRAIVEPWSQEKVVEVGERKWSPHQARLTIFEGPEIPLAELSMGRGWGTVQRDGENVTERVLAAAKAGAAGTAPAQAAAFVPPVPAGQSAEPDLLALLGGDAPSLLEAWRHASALYRNRSPSERLALAEEALRSSGER